MATRDTPSDETSPPSASSFTDCDVGETVHYPCPACNTNHQEFIAVKEATAEALADTGYVSETDLLNFVGVTTHAMDDDVRAFKCTSCGQFVVVFCSSGARYIA